MAYDDGVLLDGSAVAIASVNWPGGPGTFRVSGVTTQTVTLQIMLPDNSWVAADKSPDTFTTFVASNGGGNFDLDPGPIRAFVVGTPLGVKSTARKRV